MTHPDPSTLNRAVLLLTCPDGPGIVADVSAWVAAAGGNIVDAGQTSDLEHGIFVQRVEFDHGTDTAALRTSFAPVAERWSMIWDLRVPLAKARLAVLVSRQPHCLYDLLARCATGDVPAEITTIVSDLPDLSPAAERFGVTFRHEPIDPAGHDSRAIQEAAVIRHVRAAEPDLIVLARYMRVLSPAYCDEFGSRTINIHHSFLPAFVGANAYRQAWERGVKLIGATAHYVTADLDQGPIIAQDVARVSHGDSPATMARRGRDLESLVLATAVRAHLEHRVVTYAGRTVVFE
jgi:formyltetrahydrofolate deformylase